MARAHLASVHPQPTDDAPQSPANDGNTHVPDDGSYQPAHDSLTNRRELTELLLRRLATATHPDARLDLIERVVGLNLDLADGLARRYVHRGIEPDDLVQVARMGLLLAVKRFRPGAGPTFAAFAVPTILGELRRHFRDHGWVVRPPRRLQELGSRARACRGELEQELGRTPTPDELAACLGVSSDELHECASADSGFRLRSLDADADDPQTAWLRDEDDALELLPDILALRQALADLPPRERDVLVWRFGHELTQSQIAARIGVSQMQVSRILSASLARLRHSLADDDAALAG